jgi:hypothetical protein
MVARHGVGSILPAAVEAITRKQLLGLGIAVILALMVVDGLVAPPAHDVHSIGATAVAPTIFRAQPNTYFGFHLLVVEPTERLADLTCAANQAGAQAEPCTAEELSRLFPTLRQTDHTLYYVWSGCRYPGRGSGYGYNFEYLATGRTLVLHCYMATGWLYVKPGPGDRAEGYQPQLLAIATASMGRGDLHFHEDDRLEHLAGDLSNEYDVGTVSIS